MVINTDVEHHLVQLSCLLFISWSMIELLKCYQILENHSDSDPSGCIADSEKNINISKQCTLPAMLIAFPEL